MGKRTASLQGVLFDPALKSYRTEGGDKLPSVTGILRAGGMLPDYSGIDPKYKQRGTDVHFGTERLDHGTPMNEVIDPEHPEYAGYYEAWQRAREAVPFRVLESEKLIYHPALFYCGKPDRLVVFPGGVPGVVDLKTGRRPNIALFPQVAAYGEMFRAVYYPTWKLEQMRLIGIRIGKDGAYSVTRITEVKAHLSAFLSSLNLYYWRKKYQQLDFDEEEETA